jgi:cytochrome c-type biogenesis protein CcmH/NrfG
MFWVGVTFLSMSGVLFLLYFLLPYEQYRRMKIDLYRDNLANMDSLLKNVAEAGKQRIIEMTPDLLAQERRSFSVLRPAVVCAVIGCAFILIDLMR